MELLAGGVRERGREEGKERQVFRTEFNHGTSDFYRTEAFFFFLPSSLFPQVPMPPKMRKG